MKKLPRYSALPAVLVGRLAVDVKFRGRGIGSLLLADAAERVLAFAPASYPSHTLRVDAKNEQAAAFYERMGFRRLASRPSTLSIPLATAQKLWLE